MDIGCYGADEKTKEWDKAYDQNVEYTYGYSDALFILMFPQLCLEFRVPNIQLGASLQTQPFPKFSVCFKVSLEIES